MKTKLGIHNESDITRIIGEKVLEGKMPKGARGKVVSKYRQTMVKPKNHRFQSYARVLNSFP